MEDFNEDVATCVKHLKEGKIILYPTDTVWGLGCDALNDEAVKSIIQLKNRSANKSFVILMEHYDQISLYASPPSEELLLFRKKSSRPVTFILDKAKNLSPHVISDDRSIAVRIPEDAFCLALLRAFGGPIVSTSANLSNMGTPSNFASIEEQIKKGADYTVLHRQSDQNEGLSSRIIRQGKDGTIEILRD